MGRWTSVTLLVAQRLLFCRIVRRAFGEMTAERVIVDGANLPPSYLNRDIIDARASGLRTDLDDPYMLDRLGTVLQDYDRVTIVCAPERKVEWARALKGVNILGEIVMPEIAELRSEEHTSELQSLMRISYAVSCLKKKKRKQQ